MPLQRKNYLCIPEAVGPYVHAVAHQGILHISGLTAFATKAQAQETDLQAREIVSQISAIAEEQRVSLANLVKVTIFVTDLSALGELRSVLANAYGDHRPASSLVEVQKLFHPDLKIEIEATLALT
ncbi:RidA family protein [Pseudovibrio sp. Ad37]|uniref:RidA family protein n=1 Tax=Pseudovibrio sp. Ad37 TaxID=989422 RepID=UPI0007AE53A5|nr:RidA family protein [Pseudovibrio sp. Ad37]KZL27684.1 Enamine/imine deaminase [Pseudovibrio sp. Ad37]